MSNIKYCSCCYNQSKNTKIIDTLPYCLECYGTVLLDKIQKWNILIGKSSIESCGPSCYCVAMLKQARLKRSLKST